MILIMRKEDLVKPSESIFLREAITNNLRKEIVKH